MNSAVVCPSCKNYHNYKFCPKCGEKRYSIEDISIKYFYEHIIEAFFNLDSKTWRTIYFLFFPGRLSSLYIKGTRNRTLMPTQLFLIANVLFYFAFSNTAIFFTRIDDMASGYESLISSNNYFHYNVGKVLKDKSEKYVVTTSDLNKAVETKANDISKAFLFFIVPIWGFIIYYFFRKHQRYFIPGHVLALHALAFYMLTSIIYIQPFFKLGYSFVTDLQLLPFHAIFGIYIIFSLKKIYNKSLIEAMLKGSVIITSFFFLISIYKQLILILAFILYPNDYIRNSFLDTFHNAVLITLLVMFFMQFLLSTFKNQKLKKGSAIIN